MIAHDRFFFPQHAGDVSTSSDELTYSKAKREEVNILHRLKYHDQRAQFFAHVLDKRQWKKPWLLTI
jgi:hypothetical protein